MSYPPNQQQNQYSVPAGPPPFYATEEFREMQEIKRRGSYIGVALIMTFVFSIIFGGIFYGAARLFTSNSYQSGPFQGIDPILYFLANGVSFILCFFLPFFLVAKMMRIPFSDLILFQPIQTKLLFSYVAIGLMPTLYANAAAEKLQSNFRTFGLNPSVPDFPYDNHFLSILLHIVVIAVLPALIEEFAFRGVVLGALRKFGDGFAILVSAALFGLAHGNIQQTPFAFILGIVFGYLAVKTNSLLPSILAHFFNNFLVIILQIVSHNTPQNVSSIVNSLIFLLIFVLGALGLFYILKQDKTFFSIAPSDCALSLKKRIKNVVFNVGMVVGLIVIFIEMITISVS